ncbi:hypothetical protein EV426DRAFT_711384 [Tirmania nivea]|nr:hypothetical protein EV426DRAFT_711384 [Tirmania nivea]
MDDDSSNEEGKFVWKTSYSNIGEEEAQRRLGFRIQSLKPIAVDRILAEVNDGFGDDHVLKTKEKVYNQILQYLEIEGYPTEVEPDFKEASISDLIYATISPILSDFIRKTGRKDLVLRSEKEIIATDKETGGYEEFVVVDLISVTEERFVFVVDGTVGKAMRQCLLAMKDMRDNNGDGKVYGFVTTGELWQMLEYDGKSFRMTDSIPVVFRSMDREKERWMKEGSLLVNCMNMALKRGG